MGARFTLWAGAVVRVSKQTVFLAVRGGFTPRFLLRTEIVATLRRLGMRVIVLTPNAEEEYIVSEMGRAGAVVERMRVEEYEQYLATSRVQRIFQMLRLQILSSKGDLTTIKQMEWLNNQRLQQRGIFGRIIAVVLGLMTRLARRSRLVRCMIVGLESVCFRPVFHMDLYRKYSPRLLVVTSLGYADSGFDCYLMREARRFRCKIVATVLSWDNTSSKGLKGGPVDYAVAWTETMKRELIDYHDLKADQIFVCGPPHFDIYYRDPVMKREDLFELFGMDPTRKLLTLGTKSPALYAWNEDLVDMIANAIANGKLLADCQLLVRLHPIYYRQENGRLRFGELVEGYTDIQQRYNHVYVDYPHIISRKLHLDMPGREMDKLAAILRFSSVLVNIYSTLNLEAAIVDTPIVNVSFNGYGNGKRAIQQDVALDEVQPHNQRVVRSGGVTIVKNENEMVQAINAYLRDPSLHGEGRRLIRERECGPNPGTAGRAIGELLAVLAQRG